jgi:hypothetical protein
MAASNRMQLLARPVAWSLELSGLASAAACRALPWVGLSVVSLLAAHAMELAVAVPPTQGTPASPSHSMQEPIPNQTGSDGQHHVLLTIILRDASTGKDMPWQCVSASDQVPVEELVVDANALADVAAGLCIP